MSLPVPGFVDERFLKHRLRATGHAGMLSAVCAIVLAFYRYLTDHGISRDLLAVALLFIVVKYALFFWYRRTD
jgi:hypothetical protein